MGAGGVEDVGGLTCVGFWKPCPNHSCDTGVLAVQGFGDLGALALEENNRLFWALFFGSSLLSFAETTPACYHTFPSPRPLIKV